MSKKKLQWVKGDYQGNVEITGEEKEGWTYFLSGRRIKSELIDEFMIPINHDEQIVQIPGVNIQKPDYTFTGDNDDYITDPDTGEQINLKTIRNSQKRKIQETPKQNSHGLEYEQKAPLEKVENPITTLIKKSSKDKLVVKYEFEIEIPKKDVYNIISQSFDVDLNQEIIDAVLSSIDNQTLRDSIEESINSTILSYYKS